MTERYIVTKEVADIFSYAEEADAPLAQVIETLKACLANIPEEHRSSAVLRLKASGDYASATVDVVYQRPETDDELRARLQQEQNYKSQSHARERAEYERLKRKFES